MIDIFSYTYSLKISWFKKIVNGSNSSCFRLARTLFDIEKVFNTGKLYAEHIIRTLYE